MLPCGLWRLYVWYLSDSDADTSGLLSLWHLIYQDLELIVFEMGNVPVIIIVQVFCSRVG